MKLTNRANLPEPFVVAFGIDDYERGDAALTTTEMPLPPRILSYRKKYWDDMVEDVSDRVWAFAGTTKHIVLERIARSNPERYIAEQRFSTIMPGGKKVSGKIDLYDKETRIQYDWKETSVWKFILGDLEEWTAQGNINRYLMQQNNINPVQLINVAWLKDWKKRLARTTKRDDYPQCAINVIELPMWSVGETQAVHLETAGYPRRTSRKPACVQQERTLAAGRCLCCHEKGP